MFRLHAEKAGWSPQEIARATTCKGDPLAQVGFVAEGESCPGCDEALGVYKSGGRTVLTLQDGPFKAWEILKGCDRARHRRRERKSSCPILKSQALARIVPPRQRYAYDLIVHVGRARYEENKQEKEICAELIEKKDITLSTGTISRLCDRFLIRLEALHLLAAPKLRAQMRGGYSIHIDATSDRGKGGQCVAIGGGAHHWVLMAVRISSENERYLRPFIEKTVGLFGIPIAVVMDLSDAFARSVEFLRKLGVRIFVCHYHWLGAVGTKLFDKPYKLLRNLLRASRIRSDLRAMLRELRRYRELNTFKGRYGPGRVREELLGLVFWLLEATGKKDPTFPFGLPHFNFARRCRQALHRAEEWVPPPRTRPERRAIEHLGKIAARLDKEPRIGDLLQQIEKGRQAFSELRDVLRLSDCELPRGDARSVQPLLPSLEAIRRTEIEKDVAAYHQELRSRLRKVSPKDRKASPEAVILSYLDEYGERLFGHPVLRDENGAIVAVVDRTNNIPEHHFGKSKQHLRRRLGRANLGRDLQQQPAQAALVPNLRDPEYVRILCGSNETLPAAFSQLDQQELERIKLVRDHRDKALEKIVRRLLGQSEGRKTKRNQVSCNSSLNPSMTRCHIAVNGGAPPGWSAVGNGAVKHSERNLGLRVH